MSEQRDKLSQLREELNSALQDETIPVIYFNGFMNAMSPGDVTLVLKRAGKSVAILHASYTVVKSLSVKLGQLISDLEKNTGRNIMTTDEVEQLMARPAGGNDNEVDESG